MSGGYAEFLAQKARRMELEGRDCSPLDVNPYLHDWQRDIVAWAVRTGRAALWEDTGLGKTVQQLEWARLSGPTSIVVAPLAVCQQTVREAAKLGLTARFVRHWDDITDSGIYVTNYEQLHNLIPDRFDAIVLDESSILKDSTGKTRSMLIDWARDIPHRLACSATPAPNDPEELTSQAEWLGRMTRTNMLAAYFIHDNDGWRMKKHGKEAMYQWMSQWAVAITKPSDIGGDDTGYDLPGLQIIPELVPAEIEAEGQLFATEIGGVTGRAEVRRKSLRARVDRAVELVAAEPEQSWILWCGLNAEAEALTEAIPGAVNVHGGLSPEDKALGALWFTGEACICESPLGGKLSSWRRGTTPSISGSTTPPTGNERSRQPVNGKPTMPSTARNTCASTTSVVQRSSSEFVLPKSASDTMRLGEIVTPMTQSIENGPRNPSAGLTPPYAEISGCGGNSASEPQSLTPCLPSKVVDARFAAPNSAMAPDAVSQSTTTMQPETFGGSCAVPATSGLVSFPTTLNGSTERPCTCGAGGMRRRVLVSKTSILGSGLNFQHCSRMAFVGLSDSYEQYYQAIRRCYRYGQREVVRAHIVLSDMESQIADNVRGKERQHSEVTAGLIRTMRKDWVAV